MDNNRHSIRIRQMCLHRTFRFVIFTIFSHLLFPLNFLLTAKRPRRQVYIGLNRLIYVSQGMRENHKYHKLVRQGMAQRTATVLLLLLRASAARNSPTPKKRRPSEAESYTILRRARKFRLENRHFLTI